jgi:Phospholipase/Carboxylesterase
MIMKKMACLTLIVVLVASLAGCAKATATPNPIDMIEPGDTVNGVLVTTGDKNSIFGFDLPCTEKDHIFTCTTSFGNPTNVTGAVYGFTQEELQSKWETFTYTITIEGQPVDLPAFGTIDFVHQQSGLYMRAYNVALISTDPITLTTHDVATVSGDTEESVLLIAFKSPAADDPTQPLSTAAERLGQHAYSSQKTDFDLLLYLPDEYGKDPQVTWPLILFLHGGSNITSLDWVRTEPIAANLDAELKLPLIVASPLHSGEYRHWSQPEVMDELLTLLLELQSDLNINSDQIYLAGFIEGANGVWELGLAHPEMFAALVPVGGYIGYPFTVPGNICDLKDVPIWAFHSEKDTLVPPNAQQMLVDALRSCGNKNIQFTVLPDPADNIFFTVFADPNLYTWLLEQRN